MDRVKSAQRRAPGGLGALCVAMLIAYLAIPPVFSQTSPQQEVRGVVNKPVVITMPESALSGTGAGTVTYRARVAASPPGTAPAIESGEQGVIVTCFVPGVYLLQLAAVSMEQTSCSAWNETVLKEMAVKLTVSP